MVGGEGGVTTIDEQAALQPVVPAEPGVFDGREGGISGTVRGTAWRRLGVLLFVGSVLLVQLSWLGALGYGLFRALY